MRNLALALLIVFGFCARAAWGPPPGRLDEQAGDPLQAYWEDVFSRALDHAVVGYAYIIQRGGQPVAVGAQGYARGPLNPDDSGVPMTVDTRMQIASCSKPITAVALLRELCESRIQ